MSAAAFLHLSDPYRRRLSRVEPATDEDGVAEGTCATCGFIANHAGPVECITALRDRVAILEFAAKVSGKARRSTSGSGLSEWAARRASLKSANGSANEPVSNS